MFVLHLHDDQATLVGVTFTLTPNFISLATGIPSIGEPWNKRQKIDRKHYEPYIKPGFLRHLKRVLPFRYLKDEYVPLVKLIMKYFSCEGRFSRLYAYHIRLPMHFTQVRMMNIPYFMCRNIERMTTLVQHKTPQQQFNNIYHFALIKIVVVHQLGLRGITWDDLISREFFRASQRPSEARHETSGFSYQHEGHETHTATMPVFITYQKGTRNLFAAAKRVLSPHGVEGASFQHQHHRYRIKARGQCRTRGLQVSGTLFLFRMTIQTWAPKVQILERSSMSSRQRSKPCPSTWRGLRGL